MFLTCLICCIYIINPVTFSHSVLSDALWPHGLQHTRIPCPSPIPGACTNSCPSSRWCHPTISSTVVPFSSRLQFLPASGSFEWVSSLHQVAKVLELQYHLSNEYQDLFPLGLTGLIFLKSKVFSRFFSNTRVQKHQFFSAQLSKWFNSHIHTWLLEKP